MYGLAESTSSDYVKAIESIVNTGVKGYTEIQKQNLATEIMRKGGQNLSAEQSAFLQQAYYQQQAESQRMWLFVLGGIGLVGLLGAAVYFSKRR